ncbi:MAG: 23S rRNA (adenine(2503)-C(2))-methyltransferase RlmN [Chitinophagaceae bacterium]
MQPNNPLPNIRHLSEEDLQKFLHTQKEASYKAKQIMEWLWMKGCNSFEEMSNISKTLKITLSQHFSFPSLKIYTQQESSDGTIKLQFITHDKHFIEGVYIPTSSRQTACISSQIGCSLSCIFCATGKLFRIRNLAFDEVIDQIHFLNKISLEKTKKRLSNIVFMGMGEPLLNYPQLLKAIATITSPKGLGFSPSRITVSTSGISKMITQLGNDKIKFEIALSLHATNDKKRNEIMSINEKNNLNSLIESLNYFYKKTGNKITLEYLLLHNFNDTPEDIKELIKIYRKIPVKTVNIIEYNPIENTRFKKSEKVEYFIEELKKNRVNTHLRRSRGQDIASACGQLANKK